MAPHKIYGYGPRQVKAVAAALFAGVEVESMPFTPGLTNITPWYLKVRLLVAKEDPCCSLPGAITRIPAGRRAQLSPGGQYPLLVTPSGGSLTEAGVISRYLASLPQAKPDLYPAPSGPEARAARSTLASAPGRGEGHEGGAAVWQRLGASRAGEGGPG